jgi:TonB-linked SusC/RagA family outer membrane protein
MGQRRLTFKAFLSILALILPFAISAQTVTGSVTDGANGDPLIGASIIVQGSSVGTITDIDGTYSIEAAADAVLLISYVGYTDQEVPVAGQAVVNIALEAGQVLEEVVVTGYQTQRKRDITGAVSVISSTDLNVVPAASLGQKLAGKAAGVTISTSGTPGDGTAIRVRGFNSLLNNDPLIVIDGVQTKDQFLNSINPNDIESIQVLKDAASAAVYGARASNGVIVITTKKGKAGKAKISYDGYAGVQNTVNRFDLIIDPTEYRDFFNQAATATAGGTVPEIYSGSSFPAYYNGDPNQPYSYPGNLLMRPNTSGTDWWDESIGSALITEHNVNVSGGSENAVFSITANYFKQDGTVKNTGFERYTARANSSFNAGRFTFGENLSVSRINTRSMDGGNQSEQNIITNIVRIQSIVPVLDEGGNFAGPRAPGMGLGNNPVKDIADQSDDYNNFNRIFGNVYGEVDLVEGLKFRSSLGFDYGTGFNQNATFPNYEAREPNQFTFNFSENWNNNFEWLNTNTLIFERTFADVHAFNAVVGYEAREFTGRNIGGSLVDYFVFGVDSRYLNVALADPSTRTVFSGGSKNSSNSIFAKVDYAYNDWLLLSGTIRRDGSSRFAEENRYGIFPAGSLGIRLTQFLQKDWLDELKVRVSYGISGNDAIRPDNAFNIFGGGTGSSFYDITGSNNSLATGFALTARGNPAGKWEELEQINFGIDASFWGGKFDFVLDIYSKETNDLLFTAAEPGTGGSAAPAARNIATMKNVGFDAQVTYRENLGSKLNLDVSLTLGSYQNEITRITDTETQFFSNTGARNGILTINRVGDEIGSFYGYETDGIFASQAEVDAHANQAGAAVGRLRFRDQNGDGQINDDDRVITGSFHPDLTTGLRIGLTYDKWDFSTFIFGSFGNEILNQNKIFHDLAQFEANIRREVYENAWSPSNTDSDIPAFDFAGRVFNTQPSDYFVEDASYVRFESIQLGYTFDNLPGLPGSARVYVQGQNLFTLTGYSGLDPAMSNFGRADVGAGIDLGNYPSAKTLMVGVNLSF